MLKELKTSANTEVKEMSIEEKSSIFFNPSYLLDNRNFGVRTVLTDDEYFELSFSLRLYFCDDVRLHQVQSGLDYVDCFLPLLPLTSDMINLFISILSERACWYRSIPCNPEYFAYECELCDSAIKKLIEVEPQEQPEYFAGSELREQEREERVKYKLTFYYGDGTSVFAFVSDALSSHFISSGDGVVFNLHQSYMDMGHKNATVFNIFNFPNADKICTIDVSFLPPDYDDDSNFEVLHGE